MMKKLNYTKTKGNNRKANRKKNNNNQLEKTNTPKQWDTRRTYTKEREREKQQ